jgi:hypothetical protein
MKRVHIVIEAGKVNLDFNGFPGDACSSEENMIRALYEKMGVTTDVEYSDNKREAEPKGAAERERNGH